jgi:hypothetical protein
LSKRSERAFHLIKEISTSKPRLRLRSSRNANVDWKLLRTFWIDVIPRTTRNGCDCLSPFQIAMVRPRGPGATKIWIEQKHCELFADVQSVVANGLSETAACKFIASNSKQYGLRYSLPKHASVEKWRKTLNRQYVTAKRKIINDHTFRRLFFSDDTGTDVQYGPEFIARAIIQYAYARKSSSGKFA